MCYLHVGGYLSLSTQNQENDTLKQILEKYMDKPVEVSLYNSKTRATRGENYSRSTTAANSYTVCS